MGRATVLVLAVSAVCLGAPARLRREDAAAATSTQSPTPALPVVTRDGAVGNSSTTLATTLSAADTGGNDTTPAPGEISSPTADATGALSVASTAAFDEFICILPGYCCAHQESCVASGYEQSCDCSTTGAPESTAAPCKFAGESEPCKMLAHDPSVLCAPDREDAVEHFVGLCCELRGFSAAANCSAGGDETSSPTAAPLAAPTAAPSSAPTAAPTAAAEGNSATEAPTAATPPDAGDTDAPVAASTAAPVPAPTPWDPAGDDTTATEPTKKPTKKPSTTPTSTAKPGTTAHAAGVASRTTHARTPATTARPPCVHTDATQCSKYAGATGPRKLCDAVKRHPLLLAKVTSSCCDYRDFTVEKNCPKNAAGSTTARPPQAATTPSPGGYAGGDNDDQRPIDAGTSDGLSDTEVKEGSGGMFVLIFILVAAVIAFVYRDDIKTYMSKGGVGAYTRPEIPNQAYERVPADEHERDD